LTLRSGLEDIVRTPAEFQVMNMPVAEALDVLNCGQDDLDDLVAHGLPRKRDHLERHDVVNTALHSRTGRTSPERVMLVYDRMLKAYGADWVSRVAYHLTAVARCPLGAACAAGSWSAPELDGVLWEGAVAVELGVARWDGRVYLEGREDAIRDERVAALWARELGRYRFHFTPVALARDTAHTAATGAGDCLGLSLLLLQQVNGLGIDARLGTGFLFGGRNTQLHHWVEFRDRDGVDKVLDPSMAALAEPFFTPRYRAFCAGSRFNRLVRVRSQAGTRVQHACAGGETSVRLEVSLRRLGPAVGDRQLTTGSGPA
jgi:hypothetical protein